MKTISISPITRLEGHGKIDIFLDDSGAVERAYFQVPELRGFEKFVQGRPVEEMPQITSRICGVCPTAHHMAATKALDNVYKVDPPPAAKKIRELIYSTFMCRRPRAPFLFSGRARFCGRPGCSRRRAECAGSDRESWGGDGQKGDRHAAAFARIDGAGWRKSCASSVRLAGRRGQAHNRRRAEAIPGGCRRSRRFRPVHA